MFFCNYSATMARLDYKDESNLLHHSLNLLPTPARLSVPLRLKMTKTEARRPMKHAGDAVCIVPLFHGRQNDSFGILITRA